MRTRTNYFTAEDFEETSGSVYTTEFHRSAAIANKILAEEFAKATVVYASQNQIGNFTTWAKENQEDTHQALLLFVEPLACQHKNTRISEPHLAGARECNDCGMYYNPNQGGWRKICKHEPNQGPYWWNKDGESHRVHFKDDPKDYVDCKHCGVKLVADWRAV